jgi:hypothetical protein
MNIKQLLQKKRDSLSELDRNYQHEREKLLFVINELEQAVSETPTRGRRKSGESVPDLAEKILDSRPEGLSTPSLLTELKKLGYETESKNPINSVNSLLHRKALPFVRMPDGRWLLEKYQRSRPTEKFSFVVTHVDEDHIASNFTKFLLSILKEHDGLTNSQLATEAAKKGWAFKAKRPATSVHFGLLNAAKRKLVTTRDGRWYQIPHHGSTSTLPSEVRAS